jgi:hypothetical protein
LSVGTPLMAALVAVCYSWSHNQQLLVNENFILIMSWIMKQSLSKIFILNS